jgi:O-6-methylguanine DNA methyltransferase
MNAIRYTLIDSPLGQLLAIAACACTSKPASWQLTELRLRGSRQLPALATDWLPDDGLPLFVQLRDELTGYFAGRLETFSLPLAPCGTQFQQAAWQQLLRIPYGETRSYAQQAQAIGKHGAARAVGAANARNPIAIVIPCHRVIGADGCLTGYASGLEHKRWLLAHEARYRGAMSARKKSPQ